MHRCNIAQNINYLRQILHPSFSPFSKNHAYFINKEPLTEPHGGSSMSPPITQHSQDDTHTLLACSVYTKSKTKGCVLLWCSAWFFLKASQEQEKKLYPTLIHSQSYSLLPPSPPSSALGQDSRL